MIFETFLENNVIVIQAKTIQSHEIMDGFKLFFYVNSRFYTLLLLLSYELIPL